MNRSTRNLSLAIALCLVFLLAACGNAKDTPTPEPTETAKVETTVPPTATPEITPEPSEAPEPTSPPTPAPTAAPPKPTAAPTPAPTVEPTQDPNGQPENASIDLQAFYDTITSSYTFSSLGDMDSTILDAYYAGLTAISSKQFIAKMAMISASPDEFVLIECENADDAATAASIFEARKQAQVDGGAWYPATIAVWENAQIITNGNYVMLISHESAADIASSFNALFTE